MTLSTILNLAQILVTILLITTILVQQRGTGLGGAFGGAGTIYRSKRGVEQIVFNLTVGLAILFVIVAVLNLIVQP